MKKKENRLKDYKENCTDEYLANNNIVTTEESVNKEDNKVKNISLRNKTKKKIVAKSNKVTVISGKSKVRILKNGYIRTKKKGEVKLKVINKKQVYYIVLHIK